jgi:hypothetical protein
MNLDFVVFGFAKAGRRCSASPIPRQALSTEALTERRSVVWLGKAEHHKVSPATAQGVRSRRHRKGVREAAHDFAVRKAADLPDRERYMMRPFAVQLGAPDLALALGYCRGTAISFFAGCLNSLPAISMASVHQPPRFRRPIGASRRACRRATLSLSAVAVVAACVSCRQVSAAR